MKEDSTEPKASASQDLCRKLISPVREATAVDSGSEGERSLGAISDSRNNMHALECATAPDTMDIDPSTPYFSLLENDGNEEPENACDGSAHTTTEAHPLWVRKIVFRALALIGCMCLAIHAEATPAESSYAAKGTRSVQPVLHTANSLLFYGKRLADTYPSALETAADVTEQTAADKVALPGGDEEKSGRERKRRFAPKLFRSKKGSIDRADSANQEQSGAEQEAVSGAEDEEKPGSKRRRFASTLFRSKKVSTDGVDSAKPEETAEKVKKRGWKAKLAGLMRKGHRKERRAEGLAAAGVGTIFEADLWARILAIGREVTGSFEASINNRKEHLERLEAGTADGASCLKALADRVDKAWMGSFPHELLHIREGILIQAAAHKLLEDLRRTSADTSSKVRAGSKVKILDASRYSGEQVFVVRSVEGKKVKLDGIDRAVEQSDLIAAADPMEIRFVDTLLQNSWRELETEDTALFTRLLEYAELHGFDESLKTAQATGNFSGLFETVIRRSTVARLLAGVRELLGAPSPSPPEGKKATKKWKDASTSHSIFTAAAAAKMAETLEVLIAHYAFPGCLSLTASNLLVQGSVLLVRLLERYMIGSELASPMGQVLNDNPVTRFHLASGGSPIQKISGNKTLQAQCQVGVYSELGVNATAVANLSCHAHWQRVHKDPLGPGSSLEVPTSCLCVPPTELLPPGLLHGCNSDCLVKVSMRDQWINQEAMRQRKRLAPTPTDLMIGDALRMSGHFSYAELTDLDKKLAAAWMAGRLLLEAAREPAKKLVTEAASESRAQQPVTEAQVPYEGTEQASSMATDAAEDEQSSSQSASLLESESQQEPESSTSRNSDAPFVVGGDVNAAALNLLSTVQICKSLLGQGVPNLALLAQSVFTNIRGYISAAGAGLQNSKEQRKVAKGSKEYSALYQYFMCGFNGELLPSLFAPFASVGLQVASFLRVELEESKSFPWSKVVQLAGEGVFSPKAYDSALKHLEKKAKKFFDNFTPCVANVKQPANLLMLPQGMQKKGSLLKRLKGLVSKSKGRRTKADEGMCETSGEQQQLARMLVAWWALGPLVSQEGPRTPITVANTFKSARVLFTNLVFFSGQDPTEIGMELIRVGCKSNKFFVPPGWAMGSKKEKASSKPLSFKDISPKMSASLKFLQSTLGSADPSEWTLPLRVSQKVVDACGRNDVVSFEELLSTDEGSKLLNGFQCIKLQEQAVQVLSKVLGKRSKTVNQGLVYVLHRFFEGVHVFKMSKGVSGISAAFGKFVNTSDEAEKQAILQELNGAFPSVDCAWKHNERAKDAMLRKATSYSPPPPPPGLIAAAATDLHCPAAATLRVEDFAKASQPQMTDFCTSSSAQCSVSNVDEEYISSEL
ncbi:hypothetical protein Efla_003319 [Eimeria flavescens]